jgi:thioredoxin 1
MAGITFTDANFQEQVLHSKLPVFIDFWAEWCPPCKVIAPVIDTLAQEFAGKMVIGKMDADANPHVPGTYNVMSLPTILIFKNGQPIHSLVGARSKQMYTEEIQKVLAM